jgi:CRP/FNR family transcriptional regulator
MRARNGAAVASFPACARCFESLSNPKNDLPSAFWSEIATICRHLKLSPRQSLLEAGNHTGSVFRVAHGSLLELRFTPDGRRQVIRFLHQGDFFGRLQMLPYTHAVTSITAAEVCAFPREALSSVMQKHPKAEAAFMAAVEDELAAAERHIALLGRGKADERLAGFLLDLLPYGPGNDQIIVSMTRADIADYLGISTETVSRMITQFTEEGLLRPLDRQRFHVEPRALGAISQDE